MRFILLFLFCSLQLSAQHYLGKAGTAHFFSEAPLENIEAVNKQLSGVIDLQSGEFVFRLKIEDFQFENALMQEHFNENYLESEQYPLSTFTGVVAGITELDVSIPNSVEVKGELFIHGMKQTETLEATLTMEGESLLLSAHFPIRLVDYEIDIPKVVFYNIAEVVEVSIQMTLDKLNQK